MRRRSPACLAVYSGSNKDFRWTPVDGVLGLIWCQGNDIADARKVRVYHQFYALVAKVSSVSLAHQSLAEIFPN
jgi:hypothetical protein